MPPPPALSTQDIFEERKSAAVSFWMFFFGFLALFLSACFFPEFLVVFLLSRTEGLCVASFALPGAKEGRGAAEELGRPVTASKVMKPSVCFTF